MKDIEQRIVDLSPEKRALLEQQLQERRTSVDGDQGIPRRQEDAFCTLSFAQQRMWFLNQMDPGSAVYNMPKAIQIKGGLNLPALKRTLDAIVTRHEVLRTTYSIVDGSPVQVVGHSRSVELPVIDLTASSTDRNGTILRPYGQSCNARIAGTSRWV